MADKLHILAKIEPDGGVHDVVGRDAWALKMLIDAGKTGCTPITRPAPRWSHYIYKLRGFGFVIETIHEPHDGPFAGTHGRYVLRSAVTVIAEKGRAA